MGKELIDFPRRPGCRWTMNRRRLRCSLLAWHHRHREPVETGRRTGREPPPVFAPVEYSRLWQMKPDAPARLRCSPPSPAASRHHRPREPVKAEGRAASAAALSSIRAWTVEKRPPHPFQCRRRRLRQTPRKFPLSGRGEANRQGERERTGNRHPPRCRRITEGAGIFLASAESEAALPLADRPARSECSHREGNQGRWQCSASFLVSVEGEAPASPAPRLVVGTRSRRGNRPEMPPKPLKNRHICTVYPRLNDENTPE